jgi:hypothetical protein
LSRSDGAAAGVHPRESVASKPKPKRTSRGGETPALHPAFRAVVEAFGKNRRVTHGGMMSSDGLKVNERNSAMYGRGPFVAKLPKVRVDELVTTGTGERFDPGHGRFMKEWVALASPDADCTPSRGEARR